MVAAEHCTVMVKCMRATGSLAGAVAKARAKICMQTYCIVAAAAAAAVEEVAPHEHVCWAQTLLLHISVTVPAHA